MRGRPDLALCRRLAMQSVFLWVSAVLVLLEVQYAVTEVFTALADMEELLETQNAVVQSLATFISAQDNLLVHLRRFHAELSREHKKAQEDVQAYITNPISAYILVKHLTSDWKEMLKLLEGSKSKNLSNVSDYQSELKFPSDDDLSGAVAALVRLQDTYKLDISALARGFINGIQYSSPLTAGDCFVLGHQSYITGKPNDTVQWMTEALQRYTEEKRPTVNKSEILEYLAVSHYLQGDVQAALDMTNELLSLVPNHEAALDDRVYYQDAIAQQNRQKRKGKDGQVDTSGSSVPTPSDERMDKFEETPLRKLYKRLCRGEQRLSPSEEAKLKCRYVHKQNPFLFLAPFREEEASLNPRIVLYHNVLSDAEIGTIRSLAQPRLERSRIEALDSGDHVVSNFRVSKSAVVGDEEHYHVANIARRVEDFSGLTCDTAEHLQVVNYGIGGQYEAHFDYGAGDYQISLSSGGAGDRIATTLFYMTDVPQGGATVFPHLRVALHPRKGSAAFWFNFHRNGTGDTRTLHAACPVLIGSKWVANKWLSESGQEFRRKCGLTEDED